MKLAIVLVLAVVVLGALVAGLLQAGGEGAKVGDMAPDFALPGSDGKVHRLADLRGRTVVLAWFPKAFTGG